MDPVVHWNEYHVKEATYLLHQGEQLKLHRDSEGFFRCPWCRVSEIRDARAVRVRQEWFPLHFYWLTFWSGNRASHLRLSESEECSGGLVASGQASSGAVLYARWSVDVLCELFEGEGGYFLFRSFGACHSWVRLRSIGRRAG